MRRAFFLVGILFLASMHGQYQPEQKPNPDAFDVREDLASAGDLSQAERIVRFIQVSDAHIVDDDAPFPVRQEPFDEVGDPIDGGARDHEEISDEVLNAAVVRINAIHAEDAVDFVLNTGDNIDNQLENELMRFIDNWEGRTTTVGPISGRQCAPDGQSEDINDASSDVTETCTHLPDAVAQNNTPLAEGLPWYSAFGNHDGLYQGNTPKEPSYDEAAEESGRRFVDQEEYVDMHFQFGKCVNGQPGGDEDDDHGHGYGFAKERLCDDNPDNDGYYTFEVRGVLFVILDTLNDDWAEANPTLAPLFTAQEQLGYDVVGGYADGAIDPEQWAWLQQTLDANPTKPIVVAAHHTVKSMFGESARDYCGDGPCMADFLSQAGYVTAEELTEELASHPNVLAFVGGHTHKHRIEAMAGADGGGFWNIETSSLLDWPQEPRIIEIWTAPDGKWLITTKTFQHDFVEGIEASRADRHADEARFGQSKDRDAFLWVDAPVDVVAEPQASLPRILRVVSGNATGTAGELLEFTVHAADLLREQPVDGLNVTIDIGHPEGQTFVQIVPAGTAMDPLGNGTYGIPFRPTEATTHFATIVATDATGQYEDVVQVFSIIVEGDGEESTATPMPVLPLLLVLLAALRRR